MRYRTLGKTGIEVSALSFGCMRLPLAENAGANPAPDAPIDEETATRMIRYAMENGINYFDTAYPYHGGKSEALLGKALKPDREKVMVATKLPSWLIEKPADFEKFLDEQLERLDTNYIDFYLLHGLNRTFWENIEPKGALEFLDKIQKDGRARQVGFSFHDGPSFFKEVVDSYDWALCQIQYNYFDENNQAGREGLEYATAKGLGIVIMEPLRGGKLVGKIPDNIQSIWESAQTKRTPVEWAFEWVWNHPEVSTVLSGMSDMAQLVENVTIANRAAPNAFSADDLNRVQQVKEAYQAMIKVDCTACRYCMPCPNNVAISSCFSLYNDVYLFDNLTVSKNMYNMMLEPKTRADNCNECGECEEKCPQKIEIIDALKDVHQVLGS
ncbi:MAG: aldo/keto reductase [Deltaproteobacteria bacterium]|nr:aldo/keto reductase [Deltaproteobacteria bacterium]